MLVGEMAFRRATPFAEHASTNGAAVPRVQANAGRQPSTGPYGISSTLWAEFLGVADGGPGPRITETSALGLPAFFRGVSIIAGSIGSLPIKTYRQLPDGTRERVPSVFDDPGLPLDMRPSEWKSLHATWMAIHGETFFRHLRNPLGQIVGLEPVHPLAVTQVARDGDGRKLFTVHVEGGRSEELTGLDMTQVMRLSVDGLRGVSPIRVLREALGSGLQAQRAASRMFSNGSLLGGIITADEDLEDDEAEQMVAEVRDRVTGADRAGDIAFLNARLKFTPWSMTADDAQFLESREFAITDIARILGIPPHLLAQTEKQTSWGTGVTEQNRGLARFTLVHYSDPMEEALASLLPEGTWAEFEYAKLLKPTPEQERESLMGQVNAGLISLNEARHILNLPPVEGGDAIRVPAGVLLMAGDALVPPTGAPDET